MGNYIPQNSCDVLINMLQGFIIGSGTIIWEVRVCKVARYLNKQHVDGSWHLIALGIGTKNEVCVCLFNGPHPCDGNMLLVCLERGNISWNAVHGFLHFVFVI